MDPLTLLTVLTTLFSIGSSLSVTGQRKKRERGQIGLLQEQFANISERPEEINAFFDSLTEFTTQGTELQRKGASQDFVSQALRLGQEEREGIRRSGMVKTSTQDLEVERELGSRKFSNVLDLLEQNRQGQLLGIGKERETELQGIEDILFQLESEILGKGGSVITFEEAQKMFAGGLSSEEALKLLDTIGSLSPSELGALKPASAPNNIFSSSSFFGGG
ncbi:hypothetical protein LCGC14_0364720 [marine sediment metagenome]|uniref:Uncharacterized protein n=1 Tax=marine sediment metagenome TaxID=412755 RepID=A0A0F9T6Y4_9ZZZZ